MTSNSKTAPADQLMTLVTIVFLVRSVITLQSRAKNMNNFDVVAFNKWSLDIVQYFMSMVWVWKCMRYTFAEAHIWGLGGTRWQYECSVGADSPWPTCGGLAGWIWFNKWTCESGRHKKNKNHLLSPQKKEKNLLQKKSTYSTSLGLPKETFPHH
jgi:hypothetical protein